MRSGREGRRRKERQNEGPKNDGREAVSDKVAVGAGGGFYSICRRCEVGRRRGGEREKRDETSNDGEKKKKNQRRRGLSPGVRQEGNRIARLSLARQVTFPASTRVW